MYSRRTLLSWTMSGAALVPGNLNARAQEEIDNTDLGETQVLGLSPDASTIVCWTYRGQHQLEFLDRTTLETKTTTDAVPETTRIDTRSLVWNDAGTHVALSLDAWKTFGDSDIIVAEAATGEIWNLTPEGNEDSDDPVIYDPKVFVDVYPTWMDDETLVFARHVFRDESNSLDLMQIPISGGEPEQVLDLADSDWQYVSGPMHRLLDGRLVTVLTDSENESSIAVIQQDGTVDTLPLSFDQFPLLTDANDNYCLVINGAIDGRNLKISYDDPDGYVDLKELFNTEQKSVSRSVPIFGPAEESILWVAGEDSTILIHDGDDVREVGRLPSGVNIDRAFWEQSTAVLCQGILTWIVDTAA